MDISELIRIARNYHRSKPKSSQIQAIRALSSYLKNSEAVEVLNYLASDRNGVWGETIRNEAIQALTGTPSTFDYREIEVLKIKAEIEHMKSNGASKRDLDAIMKKLNGLL